MTLMRSIASRALDASSIDSYTRFSWLGRRAPLISPVMERHLSLEVRREHLLSELASRLYDWYVQGTVQPAERRRPRDGYQKDEAFVRKLTLANNGGGAWEPGWKVMEVIGDRIVATRGGMTLSAPRHRCRHSSCRTLSVGEETELRFPKEALSVSPGFYLALGTGPSPTSPR